MDIIRKVAPQNFNDLLCLIVIVLIVLLWVLTGVNVIALPETVTGATIATWTLIVQYYFRRKPTNGAS